MMSTARLLVVAVIAVAAYRSAIVGGAPSSRRSRSTFPISYLLDLGKRDDKPKTQPPPTVLSTKYVLPDQLTAALMTLMEHVREANITAKRHATEAMSFIGVMGSPSQLERSATELMRELRHVWKGLRRHQPMKVVRQVAVEYETLHNLLSQIVRKLKRARPAPAIQWLRAVYVNYSIQQHSYDQLKSQSIKLVWKASTGRANDTAYIQAIDDAIRSLSTDCQRLAPRIESAWAPSRKALADLSKPALHLDNTMRSNSQLARYLVKQLRQSVLRPMARDLRTLADKVKQNGSLYVAFASNVVSNDWEKAVSESHQSFLVNQTPSQRRDLDSLMQSLKKLVMNLAEETIELRRYVMDLLGYVNKNSSKSPPPVLTDIEELTSALQFFKSAPSIADGKKIVSQLLRQLRRLIKDIPKV